MKNIYCIVGPSGCGKTTLVEALEKKYGFSAIQSYTTRPPRYEGETGHIFVSPEEFKALGEMCAYTKFDGYEYGVTPELIEHNDLYVIEPSGVEFLRNTYKGNKGVKVIGITAPTEVLIERMQQRGDSDEKIVKRLANDAERFRDFNNVVDITLRSDNSTVDELCEAMQWHMYNFEYWSKHEFTLLNERGEDIYYGRETRFYTLEEFKERLKQNYPDGLPEGWTVRDDTEDARNKYLKAIKRLNPGFKSSMININMENAGVSHGGYTAVAFKYKGKEYYYRAYNGEEWITEKEGTFPLYSSAEDKLQSERDFISNEIEKINKKFEPDYVFYGLDVKDELENKKVGLVKALGFVEKALTLVQKEVNIDRPDLNKVIEVAKGRARTCSKVRKDIAEKREH